MQQTAALPERGAGKVDIVTKCLALYFVMMPFDSFPVFGMGSLLKAFAVLPIAAVIVSRRRMLFRANRLTFTFLIYVLACAVTAFYSVSLSGTWYELKRLLLNSVLMLVACGLHDSYRREDLDYLIKALVIGGLATVVLTLFFSDTSTSGRLTLKINGVHQDQNYINGYMYFAFAYFMNKVVGERKVLYGIPSIFLFIFTLMTGSRGATVSLIALGIMVFIYYLFNTGRVRRDVFFAAVVILVLSVVYADFLLSLLPDEVASRFHSDYYDTYRGTNRTELWAAIFRIFQNSRLLRKLFGFGYGTVPVVNTYNHMVAHNLWLDHLLMGGLVGVALLTYLHYVFLMEAWRLKDPIIFATYVGYLTMCMTLSLTNYKPLWNCMMMIMILRIVRMNEETE